MDSPPSLRPPTPTQPPEPLSLSDAPGQDSHGGDGDGDGETETHHGAESDDVDVDVADAAPATVAVAPPVDVDDLRRRWKGKARAMELEDPALTPRSPHDERSPLSLLKLPVDILRLILHEVAQPNKADLLSLILVNSTLHDLAVPYIYSSFSIVWPDEGTSYFRPSRDDLVDALTHGLSSLALDNNFAKVMHRLHGLPPPRRQESNARFIKKFSISNGETKWVAYYSMANEAGMMLNTLVALALPKMKNLESFKWDMPTGLSSNVFMALASLDDDHLACLDEVWIRWHEDPPSTSSSSSSPIFHNGNIPAPPPPPPMAPPANPPSPPSSNPESLGSLPPFHQFSPYQRVPYKDSSVEYPTYSVLPALRSIAALDVDQVSYLDELAILIERSKSILRELRISVAVKSAGDDFTQIKGDQHDLRQYDPEARWPGESRINGRRLGGVLGVALARVYDLRRNHPRRLRGQSDSNGIGVTGGASADAGTTATSVGADPQDDSESHDPDFAESGPYAATNHSGAVWDDGAVAAEVPTEDQATDASSPRTNSGRGFKLALECLELARVPLHTTLCAHAIDWTVLTTLTILNCDRQDRLWRVLREQFRPTPPSRPSRRDTKGRLSKEGTTYHLRLKNIHVDITTFALIYFIKETLAPHTIETLFLHDRRTTVHPTVPIATLFACTVKRHYSSLRKLLLDSSHPNRLGQYSDYRRLAWALPTEMILDVTSGRMTNLRELSVCLQPKDWHTLLQRLPNMPNLTALHMPSLGRDTPTSVITHLAQQIVDVIALRPEIRLCFLAIKNFCYQVVESTHGNADSDGGIWSSDEASSPSVASDTVPPSEGAFSTEDSIPAEDSDDESHSSRRLFSDHGFPLASGFSGSTKTYRLRKIFFYEEEVAIFKARHGVL